MQFNDSSCDGTSWNESCTSDAVNSTDQDDEGGVFEYLYVQIPLILAYSIVFLCCFFGNLMVIVVVMVHRRMRTATNFFLANLALADFSVGIFCVYQNLILYLTDDWALGDFLCRMYHFIQGLSVTASVLILTIISIERYVVIVHPMWGRRFITLRRLRVALGIMWLLCAVYNSPRFILFGTTTIPSSDQNSTICSYRKGVYNSEHFEIYNFAFLFAFPLIVMGVLYTRISLKLWKSERLHGEKNKDCFCCFYRKKKPRKISRPVLRIIETPSIQSSITQPISRQGSVTDHSPQTPPRHINLVVSGRLPDCESSNEENDDQTKQNITGSLKSINTVKSSIVRQSSFRSGNTRRSNANIKFAQDDSESNRLTSKVPPNVLNLLHQSSCKIIINDKSSLQDNSTIKDSECDENLLINQVNIITGKMEKIPNDPTVPPTLLNDETPAVLGTVSENIRGSFRRYLIRSVSQHSHQTDGNATPIKGTSFRSSDSGRPDIIESVSLRSQNGEPSEAMKERGKGKIKRKGSKILRSRRKIIRLLIAVLCTFAACNLPYHARKFWQSWSSSYRGSSTVSTFLTITTTLILYMNSGINPFLYAFLSANFRKSVKDVILCQRHLWSTHVFSPNASNNSRLTSTSSGPASTGSMSSAVSNF